MPHKDVKEVFGFGEVFVVRSGERIFPSPWPSEKSRHPGEHVRLGYM